jgi:hypothetical protein
LPALAAGLLLIGLAAPRFVAASLSLTARNPLWDAGRGKKPTDAALDRAASDIAHAQSWVPNGGQETDRSILLAMRAVRAGSAADRTRLLRSSEAAAIAGLALSPAQPSGWARLAWLRARLGNPAGAATALRLSLETGSVMPPITVDRLALGLSLLPHMDAATKAALAREVRQAWIMAPAAVNRLARNPANAVFIRDALADFSAGDIHAFVTLHRAPPPRTNPR